MLTVKHIRSAQEHIHMAPYGVKYIGLSVPGKSGNKRLIIPKEACSDPCGWTACMELWGGHAYVMNEAGATIARYQLSDDHKESEEKLIPCGDREEWPAAK